MLMLEDHLGDILRKAREARGVSMEAAGKAAGFAVSEYAEMEKSGKFSTPPNFTSLAVLAGLDAQKLETIARGWLPSAVDVGLWRELRVVTSTREGITVHCYVVWDEGSREGALFDTGWEAEPVFRIIEENTINLRHLFLTHTHEDHVAAMGQIREKFPKAHLHTSSKHAPPQHRNRTNDFIHLGSLRITNRETPGHAEDGVIYVIGTWPEDAPHVAIIGDTLFAGSLATGLQSTDLLKQKVQEQIFTLPGETLLCPGHGPLTTVAQEKQHNPFF